MWMARKTWFLRIGPTRTLVPANIKGVLFFIFAIAVGIFFGDEAFSASDRGSEAVSRLCGAGLLLDIVVFLVVGYFKSERG